MLSRKTVSTTLVLLALCHSAYALGPAGGQDKGGTPQDNKDKKAEDKAGGNPVVTVPKSTNPLQTPEMAADGFTPSDPSTWDAIKKQRICDAIAKDWQAYYNSAVYYKPTFDACMSGKYATGSLAPNQSVEMKMMCFTPTKPLQNWGATKTNEICDLYVSGSSFAGMYNDFKKMWHSACETNQEVTKEYFQTYNDKKSSTYIAKPPSTQLYAYLEFQRWKKANPNGMFTDSCGAGDNPMNQGSGTGRPSSIPVAK